MRLPVSALLLLLAAGSGLSAPVNDSMQIRQPARVRWIVDLKKDFGYEGFQRVKSGKRWKAQQGIAFVTPDEVVVYQVKPGSSVSAAMEIDRLQLLRPISDSRPQRIDVYDLKTKARTLSVELEGSNPYFGVSSAGELAVVENDHLSLYIGKPN